MNSAHVISVLCTTLSQGAGESLPSSGPDMGMVTRVFVYASITALATGLGAIPFFLVRKITSNVVSYSNAVASGLMLGASFGLLAEGAQLENPAAYVQRMNKLLLDLELSDA